MEQYLVALKKTLQSQNIEYFWSLCGEEKLKIIRDPFSKIKQKIKKDHKKYIGKKFAEIGLSFNEKITKTDWVFAINLTIHPVLDETPDFGNGWQTILKYRLSDIEKYPFNLMDVHHLMDIVCCKTLVTDFNGIYYDTFLEKLKKVQTKRSRKNNKNRLGICY